MSKLGSPRQQCNNIPYIIEMNNFWIQWLILMPVWWFFHTVDCFQDPFQDNALASVLVQLPWGSLHTKPSSFSSQFWEDSLNLYSSKTLKMRSSTLTNSENYYLHSSARRKFEFFTSSIFSEEWKKSSSSSSNTICHLQIFLKTRREPQLISVKFCKYV